MHPKNINHLNIYFHQSASWIRSVLQFDLRCIINPISFNFMNKKIIFISIPDRLFTSKRIKQLNNIKNIFISLFGMIFIFLNASVGCKSSFNI